MKIEDRLSDAMHEYADTIEPDSGSWSKIAARFDDELASPRRPSRRPLVLAGVTLALVVVLITGLLVRDADDGTRVTTDPNGGAGAAMPKRILAITDTGQPVVLDSTTGDRQFTYGATIARGSQIAVTPDGQLAYMATGPSYEGCKGHSILQLQIGSGSGSRVVATEATHPAVSPDGRYLAFVHCAATPPSPEIELRDLATGSAFALRGSAAVALRGLSWSADSRHLAFQQYGGRAFVLDIETATSLDDARCVCDQTDANGWYGYLGKTGEFLGTVTPGGDRAAPGRVVTLDTDGVEGRTLFAWPDQVQDLRSDSSGSNVLMTTDRGLYRWSEGDDEPTKLGEYLGAAWIPDAAPPAGQLHQSPARLPNGILAVTADRGPVAMGAESGQVHATLPAPPNVSSLGPILPDGLHAVYGTIDGTDACGGSPPAEVGTVDLATGTQMRIVSGAVAPVVSPDGRFVAYGILCDGVGLGFSDLRDGRNYRIDLVPSVEALPVDSVEPVAWAPDSERLLYRTVRAGEAPRYFVGRLWPLADDTGAIEISSGHPMMAAAFVDDRQLAIGETSGRGSRVRFVDLTKPGCSPSPCEVTLQLLPESKTAFDVPGRITSLVADVSGQHLLVVTQDRALYRWSVSDPNLTKLADDVTAAAWVPWS